VGKKAKKNSGDWPLLIGH